MAHLKKTSIDIKKFLKKTFIYSFLHSFFIFYRTISGIIRLKLIKKSNIKLVVGASGVVPNGWVGSDVEYLNLLQPNSWYKFFNDNQIKAILAEHVWEH